MKNPRNVPVTGPGLAAGARVSDAQERGGHARTGCALLIKTTLPGTAFQLKPRDFRETRWAVGCDLSGARKPRETHSHFGGENHEVGCLYLEEVSQHSFAHPGSTIVSACFYREAVIQGYCLLVKDNRQSDEFHGRDALLLSNRFAVENSRRKI